MKVTAERLRELLVYDPLTGLWRWRAHRRQMRAGAVAGWLNKSGHREIQIDGQTYQASRLAFLYMMRVWPPNFVDHIDRNPSNDAWDNLRPATAAENARNQAARVNSASGIKGVSWARTRGKWVANITLYGRQIALGGFDTKEEAAVAYTVAAKKLYGEFAYLPIGGGVNP